MKCLILAGGAGNRMWPVSRKNYPKQFAYLDGEHSMFQKTIVRNMAFCDEFWISSSLFYKNIIQGQLQSFPGLKYKCFYEEEGKLTAPVLLISCMCADPNERFLVVSTDNYIENGNYKETIKKGRQIIEEDKLVCIGVDTSNVSVGIGFFSSNGDGKVEYKYPANNDELIDCINDKNYYMDAGILMGKAKVFVNEIKRYNTELYKEALNVVDIIDFNKEIVEITKDDAKNIPSCSIGRALTSKSDNMYLLKGEFDCKRIKNLESLAFLWDNGNHGKNIQQNCTNVSVMNFSDNQLVVGNTLEDLCIVNTADAIYISKKGYTDDIKPIVTGKEQNQYKEIFEESPIYYSVWGKKETLRIGKDYWVKKLTIYPGCSLNLHKHNSRSENWVVLSGNASVLLDGDWHYLSPGESIQIDRGKTHQLINESSKNLVIIETACGEIHDFKYDRDVIVEDITMDIVKMIPSCKETIWGGTKLIEKYGKISSGDNIAESWEVSAHPNGQSIIAQGPYEGMKFNDYINSVGKEVLGWKGQFYDRFPLLVKFIDAMDKLSVQVHPDDDYALAVENEYGKNEMWYIVDAEPGAYIYCGVKPGVSIEKFKAELKNNNLVNVMNKISVKKGQAFFIPAGTIHAIGKGILICEIQQNSDITYRLYDYDRADKYGKKRQLHIDKGLKVIDSSKCGEQTYFEGDYEQNIVCKCKYFMVTKHKCNEYMVINASVSSFIILVVIDGEGTIETNGCKLAFKAGESFFVPAKNRVISINGNAEILSVKI